MDRITKLKDLRERNIRSRIEEKHRLSNRKKELINEINNLASEIDELCETAKACQEAEIEIDAYHRFGNTYDSYERHTYVANTINHRLGFYVEKDEFFGVGLRNIGEGCETDLLLGSDGLHAIYSKNLCCSTDPVTGYSLKGKEKDVMSVPIGYLEAFTKLYKLFKNSFYEYVDSILRTTQI